MKKNANTQGIASRMSQQYEWLIERAKGNQAAPIKDLLIERSA
jgi:hypothetical protein